MPALKLTKPSCMTVVPLGEVGAEADPVGVGDAHAGRDDVVDHPRELVDAEHGRPAPRTPQPRADRSKPSTAHGPAVGPGHVGEQAEDAVEVDAVRLRPAGARAGAAAGRRRAASTGGADRSAITVRDHDLTRPRGPRRAPAEQGRARRNARRTERAVPARCRSDAPSSRAGVPGVEHRARRRSRWRGPQCPRRGVQVRGGEPRRGQPLWSRPRVPADRAPGGQGTCWTP